MHYVFHERSIYLTSVVLQSTTCLLENLVIQYRVLNTCKRSLLRVDIIKYQCMGLDLLSSLITCMLKLVTVWNQFDNLSVLWKWDYFLHVCFFP